MHNRVYLPKRQSTKRHNHGVVTKMRWRCTKRAARARTALLIIVPSHPVNFPLREVMGYSYAEADAPFYRIRPTLRPPVEDGNRTQNPGKRTSTRGAGAPLAGVLTGWPHALWNNCRRKLVCRPQRADRIIRALSKRNTFEMEGSAKRARSHHATI